MGGHAGHGGGSGQLSWRTLPWLLAAILWLLPLVAMRFTDEVAWDGADVALFGIMLLAACAAVELATRRTASAAYRAGVAVAVVGAFLLVWMNLAVGLIGSEDHPANLLFGGVLAVGFIVALAGRFRPRAMARALTATASAQAAVGLVAAAAGWGWPAATIGLTVLFVVLWLVAARLFRRAAGQTMAPA